MATKTKMRINIHKINTLVFTLEIWFSILLLTELINIRPKRRFAWYLQSKMIGLRFVLKNFYQPSWNVLWVIHCKHSTSNKGLSRKSLFIWNEECLFPMPPINQREISFYFVLLFFVLWVCKLYAYVVFLHVCEYLFQAYIVKGKSSLPESMFCHSPSYPFETTGMSHWVWNSHIFLYMLSETRGSLTLYPSTAVW